MLAGTNVKRGAAEGVNRKSGAGLCQCSPNTRCKITQYQLFSLHYLRVLLLATRSVLISYRWAESVSGSDFVFTVFRITGMVRVLQQVLAAIKMVLAAHVPIPSGSGAEAAGSCWPGAPSCGIGYISLFNNYWSRFQPTGYLLLAVSRAQIGTRSRTRESFVH